MFNEIVNLLTPDMGDPNGRRALLDSALWGCPVLHQINWTGAANDFTVNLVRTLLDYGECTPGKPAIVSVLEAARDRKGTNKHGAYNDLIARILNMRQNPPQGGDKHMDKATLIQFLIGVGIWAQTELSEIWKLRRQTEPTKPAIPLNDKTRMQAEALLELDAVGFDSVQAERAKVLIDQAQTQVFEWLKEKGELDRLVGLGSYDEIKAERRKTDLDLKIEKKIAEIPLMLGRLGLAIDRA